MSLPLFFLCAPDTQAPGRRAACGWHCAPEGGLRGPEQAKKAEALVFDDRTPLPDRPEALAEALLRQAEALEAGIIVLDFERPVSDGALALVRALAARIRTAAPLPFCAGSCEPIVCYRPSAQTFAEFLNLLRSRPCWAELRPVEETVSYPAAEPPPGQGAFFSEALQCHYRAESAENALILRLFDTPESFSRRFSRMAPHLTAALGLPNELRAIDFPP